MEAVLPYQYVGTELDLFAQATHWKAYLRRQIVPHLGRSVLEVGAGIGGTTRVLFDESVERWVALEPDFQLAARYRQSVESMELPDRCQIRVGTTQDLQNSGAFDSVLYIDVLEHIENDGEELTRAAQVLAPGGKLIVLAPAHNFLMCDFDRALGHFRRYNRRMLKKLTPNGFSLVRLAYFDCAGLLASLGNRFLLRSSKPSAGQIAFWDRILVRASTCLDPLLGYRVGKSVLAVWQRD